MSRILTGIQATGTPHLGNLLGPLFLLLSYPNRKEMNHFYLLRIFIRLHRLRMRRL